MLTAAIAAFAFQSIRYQRIKRLYRADYARKKYLIGLAGLLPFMPEYGSRRYRKTEKLIIDSGLKISVEGFHILKTMLFIAGFAFFTSIQTTNLFMLYDGIISDMNAGKTIIERVVKPDAEALKFEREMFDYIDACLPRDRYKLKELTDNGNSKMYIDYIELQIRSRWSDMKEDASAAAGRIYKKLIRIRKMQGNYLVYLSALAAAAVLYCMPDIAAYLKILLIEDKRDWEVLNYIYVFSIFGRMPPYNIKNVLTNMLAISDIYRNVLNEVLNDIKSGKGEASFDSLLQKVDNQELFELLEAMRLSLKTGLLNMVDNIDEMAANQLKWLEIKSIKRRKSKQVIAMVPVVLVMLIAVVYFSYSLSTLSNPMNFIN